MMRSCDWKCTDFILAGIPFRDNFDEVIYIEAEYDEEVNALIRENLTYIQEYLWQWKGMTFVYLPEIKGVLLDECIKYHAPGLKGNHNSYNQINTSRILKFLKYPYAVSDIKPGFAVRRSFEYFVDDEKNHNDSIYNLFFIDVEECKKNPIDYLKSLCDTVCKEEYICHNGSVRIVLHDYQREIVNDFGNDPEAQELSRQIKELARRLYAKGIGEYYIKQLVGKEPVLSRLVITKDYKIILPDFDNKEIVMEPMNKAVYLLFLRHPEGIAFKEMSDFRQELMKIYFRIWTSKNYPTIDWNRIDKAIDNICSPLSNSINEKTSRIKGYFLKEMHEDVASHYYIAGRYAEARKISLSQDMIEWQTPDNFNTIEKTVRKENIKKPDIKSIDDGLPF